MTMSSPRQHPRTIGWVGTTAMAMGGSNQMLFLFGALLSAQGTAAVPLLVLGLALSWFALPGWTELILMWPDRVGGISATCAEAFRPYSPVLANLAGTCYWWGWVPTCGLTALLSASALNQWYLPMVPVKLLAALLVAGFTVVNLTGLRRVTRLAVLIASGSAVLAFLSAILPVVAGHVDWQQASSFHLKLPFEGTFGKLTSAMGGLYLIGFAAPAFEAAACHVGETIKPEKNIPRAMFASAGMATLYFAVLPVVWLGVFGPTPLMGDLTQVLGPTFAPLFGGLAKSAAVWFMVLNMFHGTMTPVTGVARTLSQLSEDGLLPRVLAKRSRTDVPWVASLLTGVMAIVFLLSGDPVWVIAAANFTYLIGISLPSVAVWLLRRDEPDMHRPYRAPRGTIMLGLLAAGGWGTSTVFGFEQFGMRTVLAGLVLAYSGAVAYAWRRWRDREGAPSRVRRSLHLKLTGTMLAVLVLDGAGYALAVSHVPRTDPQLVAILQDIFVVVAILTISVGLVLPGMIAHAATEVTDAADRLVAGTLADLTRAMRALAVGDLDAARARVENDHVVIRSADEVGAMAASFNVILDEAAKAAESLDGAREALVRHRRDLENVVAERTIHATQQAAVADLGRTALAASDEDRLLASAVQTLESTMPLTQVEVTLWAGDSGTGAEPRRSTGEQHHHPLPERRRVFEPFKNSQIERAAITVRQEHCGELCVSRVDRASTFSDDDRNFLEAVAALLGSAIGRIRTETELNHQALHDPLTGLANRTLLRDRLTAALAHIGDDRPAIAVLFVDIDNFKVINDSLGHDQGDQLLMAMASRLRSEMRPGDTVARFGGDEFVVLCNGIDNEAEATKISKRISAIAATPFRLNGREHVVTLSIGIALAHSRHTSAVEILRDADAAMYEAKHAGRARTTVFVDSMRTSAVHRLETELALRNGITHGELCLHYQPIFGIDTGTLAGLEALVRWNHPTDGLISPADFISIAEETDLIVVLGEWVLTEACRQVQTWRCAYPEFSGITVAVNLSGRQITEPSLIETVAGILEASGLPPGNLVLEVTESVLMADAEAAVMVLHALKNLGVRLSIDDFGTGYSSLSYLKKFPLDILKIDRSFVDGLGTNDDDDAIVQATISLARSLGLQTVGEGVETPAQLHALRRLRCDKAQGYLLGRPEPAEQLIERLRQPGHHLSPCTAAI